MPLPEGRAPALNDVPPAAAGVLVFGNAGAGKSTLAQRLAAVAGLAHLDLDGLAWLPGEPPRRRPLAAALPDIDSALAAARGWVVEGCYATLLDAVAPRARVAVFLDPGVDTCLAHCRARPWEPHKDASPAAQQQRLAVLEDWVRSYPARDDDTGHAAHAALLARFGGHALRVPRCWNEDDVVRIRALLTAPAAA